MTSITPTYTENLEVQKSKICIFRQEETQFLEVLHKNTKIKQANKIHRLKKTKYIVETSRQI